MVVLTTIIDKKKKLLHDIILPKFPDLLSYYNSFPLAIATFAKKSTS